MKPQALAQIVVAHLWGKLCVNFGSGFVSFSYYKFTLV